MNDKNRPLIVFDLGAVLIDWDPRYLYRNLFNGNETAMERFLTEVCSPAWNVQQDAGRPFSKAIEILAGQYPEQRDLITAYYFRWEEMLGGTIEDSVEVLKEVKHRGFAVCALSNWSAETYPIAARRYDFLSWFDHIVISGQEKVAKPDPEIYKILLKRSGRIAEDCIFIDDSLMNIEAAQRLGFRTIHFRSAEQLRQELRNMHTELESLSQ